MTRIRLPIVAALAVALAAALVACGGSGGSENPQQVITDTFKPGKDYSSGKVAVDFKISSSGTQQGDLDVGVDGPFQSTPGGLPKFNLAANLKIQGGGENINVGGGLISTGDAAFVGFEGTDYKVDPATLNSFRQLFLSLEQQSGKQAGSSISPADFLTNLKNDGHTSVNGVDTIHITGTADVAKLIAAVKATAGNSQLPGSAQLDQLRNEVKSSTLDVYSSVDGNRLQKITSHIIFQPASNVPGGSPELVVDFSLSFSDLGQPQTISAPASSQPIGALLQKAKSLGGFSGLLGAVGGQGTSGSTTPAPPSSGNSSAYLQCLQNARGSAAVQACAGKLQ